ncbi:hypothetical protein EDC45_1324 [Mesocricetibacter intestinalis]|uniref:Excinuclease ABC subunit A n=1 Tax=Mesocricetibacter intestinalis TaxID=1521930 RepID=A0A4R6VBU6_9PAST|nr:excinuclease ABC subunit A [Mesocricetibacter intestinalis]TDQ57677.1 hypothetical protein EDC45_1324 [Mesocricetibacter intestinalis]
MKPAKLILITLAGLAVAACAPRDTTHYLSINDALNSADGKKVLNPNIKLYFAQNAPGKVLAQGLVSNKKTNATLKSDEAACRWAFLSALKQFQERAASMGATKVSNIVSFYKKNPYRSESQYECHAGRMIGGVALKGDIVK